MKSLKEEESSSQRQQQQPTTTTTNDNNNNDDTTHRTKGTVTTALYGIAPAMASTVCCWGPPLWMGVVGATGTGVGASFFAHRMARYRPYLLALSATMIGYSFERVYSTTDIKMLVSSSDSNVKQPQPSSSSSSSSNNCCHDNKNDINVHPSDNSDDDNLRYQRMAVWASLLVAVAGASYGRVGNNARTTARRMVRRSQRSVPTGTGTDTKTNHHPNVTMIDPIHNNNDNNNNNNNNNTTIRTIMEFSVDGMACAGCANKVQSAIHNSLVQKQQQQQQQQQHDDNLDDDGETIVIDVDHKTGKVILREEMPSNTTNHRHRHRNGTHHQVEYTTLRNAIEEAGYRVHGKVTK